MTPLDLDAIQARADAATPGPWEADGMDSGHSRYEMARWISSPTITIAHFNEIDRLDDGGNEGEEDCRFIAHAREDVPALVAAVRAVLAIHSPKVTYLSSSTEPGRAPDRHLMCAGCSADYPCRTVRAVEERRNSIREES